MIDIFGKLKAVLGNKDSNKDSNDLDMSKSYLYTEEGRIKLAMAMAAPIRRNLDYQGIAMRAFYQNTYEVYDWDFHE